MVIEKARDLIDDGCDGNDDDDDVDLGDHENEKTGGRANADGNGVDPVSGMIHLVGFFGRWGWGRGRVATRIHLERNPSLATWTIYLTQPPPSI